MTYLVLTGEYHADVSYLTAKCNESMSQRDAAQSELAASKDREMALLSSIETANADLAALREELANCQALSVTNILMDVVPGFDGMGEEIYAKSVADVQLLISNLYLKTEELEESLTAAEQRNSVLTKALERIARPHDCGCLPCTQDCVSKLSLEITVDEMRELAKSALAKPTESGASE